MKRQRLMKLKFHGETHHKNGIKKHQTHSTNLSNTEITNTLLQAETGAINNIIKLGIYSHGYTSTPTQLT